MSQATNGAVRVAPQGVLDRSQARRVVGETEVAVAGGARAVVVDLELVSGFDSFGVAGLVRAIRAAEAGGAEIRLRSASPELASYLELVDPDRLGRPAESREPESFLERVGQLVMPFFEAFRGQFELSGQAVYHTVVGPFVGKGIRWDRVTREVVLVGLDALPIIALITSLIGMILAIQAAAQLRQFGATIYIADLVGVSITREIGPLLTGLIVAGRSGSANTAEIGAMVVSEELDAMRQMGIHPARYLLVPKIVALSLAMPALGMIGDVIAISSAGLLSSASFGLNIRIYFQETQQALLWGDLTSGLVKCTVFGVIIGTISASQGLAVASSADEVGRRTTASVVVSIFYIIAADTFFTWLFHGA